MLSDFNLIIKEVDEIRNDIIAWRRDLHQHPEVGFELERTSTIVANLLKSWGLKVETHIGKIGVVGLLEGEGEKTVALRADMDALPVKEDNDVPYRSNIDGKMHACGHDGHTAMLLGAAKVLSNHKDLIKGNIKFIFQPAEEGPSPGGAKPMMDDGAIKDVSAIFGMHITTEYPTGSLGINLGPSMASTDVFEIKMIGKGGHAGLPHKSVDAISMGARVVTEIQYMVSREINPLEPIVVSIGTINGGFTSNVIAETCDITGTIRTYNNALRNEVINKIKNIVHHIAEISGGTYKVNIIPGLPPLINDLKMANFVLEAGKDIFGEGNVLTLDNPSMGGEDFAYYLQEIPGAFMWLGARNEEKGFTNVMHHPKFDFDEDCLSLGAKMHIGLALNYLNKN